MMPAFPGGLRVRHMPPNALKRYALSELVHGSASAANCGRNPRGDFLGSLVEGVDLRAGVGDEPGGHPFQGRCIAQRKIRDAGARVEPRHLGGNWSTWQAADAGVDSVYAPYPDSFYGSHLSVAPGWKVGGWPMWGYTDPAPQSCPACDTEMDPLLTIDTFEWDSSNRSWIPYEDQAAASSPDSRYRDLRQPTAVQIGSGYKQQIYICPAAPEHPHTELMQ